MITGTVKAYDASNRFVEDIFEMTGVRLSLYWTTMWRFVAPVLIAVMLCASIVSQFMEMPTYSAWDKETVKRKLYTG